VYIVYELMDTDLHQIIRSDQQLTDDHCQVWHLQNSRGFIPCHLIYTFQLILSI
jgi:sulfite exporter TauE/SafE